MKGQPLQPQFGFEGGEALQPPLALDPVLVNEVHDITVRRDAARSASIARSADYFCVPVAEGTTFGASVHDQPLPGNEFNTA